MKKTNKFKKIILIPLLILNLAAFNCPALLVLAEEGDSGAEPTEEVSVDVSNENTEVGTETENNNPDEASISENENESNVIETGDVNVELGVENEANTNIAESEITESEEPVPQIESVAEESLSDTASDNGSEEITGEGEEENNPFIDQGADLIEATSSEEFIPAQEPTLTEELNEELNNEEECNCQEPCEECQCDCKLQVNNENEAIVENNIETEGDSGENVIEDSSGDALIDTGDVNIAVGVINTVNTNITESEFSQSLLNIFEELEGDINVENEFKATTSAQDDCAQTAIDCLDVTNQNSGEIENNILIDGSSGQNTAKSTDGNVVIKTGNVNVSASILNLLNTNLVGSNWRNFIINIFANWTGDLIFPGKEKMQEFLNNSAADNSCTGSCGFSVDSSNEGQIENEVSIVADTGLNTAEGNTTIIRTGDAEAKANVFNLVNTNIVGGSFFFIAINHFGEWKGNIYSLPSNLEMAQDSDGIKIYKLNSEDLNNHTGTSNQGFDVVNDNTGIIKNSIIVNVSTGNNQALAKNGEALIKTGDANAFVNLINILNTNMIDTNWLLGIVNVFGNWQGDIAFGRPDLLIAESATTSANPVGPGGFITYTLSYFNNGDADATQVTIVDDFDENFLSVTDVGNGKVKDNPGEVEWKIGNIPAGGSGVVSYSVKISSDIPYGTTYIVNHATIDSFEEDWNGQDNNDTLSVKVLRTLPDRSVPSGLGFLPHLQITKTSKQNVVEPGSNVDYEIILTNYVLGSAYEVVVEDVLYDESSEIINTYNWDLGEVRGYEKVVINYTVAIGEEILPGFYTNVAKALAWGGYDSNEASFTIEVRLPGTFPAESAVAEPEPEEEISLEEIEKQVKEIGGKMEKIREEIRRLLPPVPEPLPVIGQISEIILPSASAQEETVLPLSESGTKGENSQRKEPEGRLEEFLAAIGVIPFDPELILIILASVALVLIGFLVFRQIKKE